jgi:hypothetical protein
MGFGGFSFIIKSRTVYAYDPNNYLVESIDYDWDDVSSTWLAILKSEITNDNDGDPIETVTFMNSIGNWVKYERLLYNYEGPVEVKLLDAVINKFALNQNYPNPFNPSTIISYSISERSEVELRIFDILGNEVALLFKGIQPPGNYSTEFNVKSLNGSNKALVSGVYIISLRSGSSCITKKCLLLK